MMGPNHSPQQIWLGHRGCNLGVPWIGTLNLGH